MPQVKMVTGIVSRVRVHVQMRNNSFCIGPVTTALPGRVIMF